MTTALAKITKKPAKKTTKKPAKKATKKPGKAPPTNAMLDAVEAMSDDVTDLLCDLDDAADAETIAEFNDAVAQASKKLARAMAAMAKLASKIDPVAFEDAKQRAYQLPALPPPALPQ